MPLHYGERSGSGWFGHSRTNRSTGLSLTELGVVVQVWKGLSPCLLLSSQHNERVNISSTNVSVLAPQQDSSSSLLFNACPSGLPNAKSLEEVSTEPPAWFPWLGASACTGNGSHCVHHALGETFERSWPPFLADSLRVSVVSLKCSSSLHWCAKTRRSGRAFH